MRYIFRSVLIAAAIISFNISSASAEVFFWQGPVSEVSVTVPDTWRQVHNQKTDEVMSFTAPGDGEYASCRMRVRDDKRFVIYPVRYSDEIQRTNYSYGFWDSYLGEFDDYVVHKVVDNASLGRGYASYAEASYATVVSPKVQKRGIMFASQYFDKTYILECSAEVHAYHEWKDAFLSVAKSVNFRKSIHEFPAGNYRDFLRDGALVIQNARPVDVAVY